MVGSDLSEELFDGLPAPVRVQPPGGELSGPGGEAERVVLAHGAAYLDPEAVRRLLVSSADAWIAGGKDAVAAVAVKGAAAGEVLRDPLLLSTPHGVAEGRERVNGGGTVVVRNRKDLSLAHRRIRDHLVTALMEAGVTFLLPESVVVDVDVRIGRDSIIYPGVVLEGQTTVGEETVVGPGCRVINSWIGSGVEMKGWNYVANTSVRNRAILEPYVRRGFD